MTYVYLIEEGSTEDEIDGIFSSLDTAKSAAETFVNRLIAEHIEYLKNHPPTPETPYRADASDWEGETYIDEWNERFDDNRKCRYWDYAGHDNSIGHSDIQLRIYEYELDVKRDKW